MKKQLLTLILVIMNMMAGFSQDICAPLGWATIGATITGGGSATPVTVSDYATLKTHLNGTISNKVIYISGTITFPSGGKIENKGSNVSVIGLPGAKLVNTTQTETGSGILIFSTGTNIILRNVTFEGPGAYDVGGRDNLSLYGSTHVWVDHCTFQDGIDGNFDISDASDKISVTWCKFEYKKPAKAGGSGGSDDHRLSNLIGGGDTSTGDIGKLNVTYQYCWWAPGCKSRMPRCRFGKIHVANCYFSSPNAEANVVTGMDANLRVENSYFKDEPNVKAISNEGFAGNYAVNVINCRFVNAGSAAYQVSAKAASATYFTPPYTLTLSPVDDVPAIVTAGAGPTMPSPTTCSGPPPTFYTLTTSIVGNGTVTLNPAGGSYPAGTVVTITATPNVGNTFSGWSGDVTGSTNPITVTVDANKSVTATFAVIPTYTLSTSVVGNGSVTLNPAGGTYPAGTVVTITANPTAGNAFSAWSGDVTGSTNPTTITMTANKSVTATFAVSTTNYTLTTTTTGTGTVTLNPAGGTYLSGTTVTLTAVPSGGMVFNGWSGAATGTTNPLTVTMTANKTINAAFITPIPTKKIAYVTDPASLLYGNDTKILPALKADTRFVVTEIDAKLTGIDYSSYDMVLISEVATSNAAGMAALKGINKPVLMMKVHAYKTAVGAWNWTSSTTAYGQNISELNIVVSDKLHPIFNGVTFVNTNEVNVLSTVTNSKGLTYMAPSGFTTVTGGTISSLAIVKGQATQNFVLQIPAGTTVTGTVVPQNFVQIGINTESYANVTPDGVKIIINACCYLLGISGTPTGVEESNQSKVSCYPTVVDNTLNIDLGDNANGNTQIDIYGVSGGKVLSVSEDSNATIALNLSGLSKGMYCCVIRNESTVTTCKFIKK